MRKVCLCCLVMSRISSSKVWHPLHQQRLFNGGGLSAVVFYSPRRCKFLLREDICFQDEKNIIWLGRFNRIQVSTEECIHSFWCKRLWGGASRLPPQGCVSACWTHSPVSQTTCIIITITTFLNAHLVDIFTWTMACSAQYIFRDPFKAKRFSFVLGFCIFF